MDTDMFSRFAQLLRDVTDSELASEIEQAAAPAANSAHRAEELVEPYALALLAELDKLIGNIIEVDHGPLEEAGDEEPHQKVEPAKRRRPRKAITAPAET